MKGRRVSRFEQSVSALGMMTLQAKALFTFDDKGNLLTTNEPEPVRAPRLFLGLTGEGFIAHHRDDVPKPVVRKLERILDRTASITDPGQMPAMLDKLREALATQAPVTEVWEGPAWRFPEVIPAPEGVTAIGPGEVDLLREHFPYTAEHLEDHEPCFAVVDNGVAVAICRSVRQKVGVAEAGVETIAAYRGRGYAPRVVAAWAREVRERGLIPLYSASGQNSASRAVARKLGLILYGIDVSLT